MAKKNPYFSAAGFGYIIYFNVNAGHYVPIFDS